MHSVLKSTATRRRCTFSGAPDASTVDASSPGCSARGGIASTGVVALPMTRAAVEPKNIRRTRCSRGCRSRRALRDFPRPAREFPDPARQSAGAAARRPDRRRGRRPPARSGPRGPHRRTSPARRARIRCAPPAPAADRARVRPVNAACSRSATAMAARNTPGDSGEKSTAQRTDWIVTALPPE